MTKTDDLHDVLAALRSVRSVLVTSHVNPDGDAIGSMLAAKHLLTALGVDHVDCVHSEPVPALYRWLPGASQVLPPERAEGPYDAALVVDVSQRERVGAVAKLLAPPVNVVVADHHLEDHPEGDLNLVISDHAATGEIIAELFEAAAVPISQDAAVCLYVAIATDTGSFRFSSTTPQTHRIAARLVETGIEVGEISSRVFDFMSRPKFVLMSHVLDQTTFLDDGRIACAAVTTADMRSVGAADGDFEGLINLLRYVEGVDVAVICREGDDHKVKVSLRGSPRVNCAAIAQRLGGGGRAAAAGATLDPPLGDALETVLREIRVDLGGSP